MRNIKNKRKIQIMIFTLIAVVTLGIGYAAISAVNLMINSNATASVNQENFKVKFTAANVTTGTGTASINNNDPKVATFDVTGLTKVGDIAVASYTVKNESSGIGVSIDLAVTNSNTEYFSVSEAIVDTELQAGDTTTATITVTMIKTPIEDAVSTSITGTLTASPLENDQATGSAVASKIAGQPDSFANDSWATIKKAVQDNNTSAYNVGDTKEVTINGTDYTVRIANKTTWEHCGDNDITYSQTACGFVVEFVDMVQTMPMKDSDGNRGGYPATLVYDYLKNTLYGQLPADLQMAIKPTRVISGYGCSSWDWNVGVCSVPNDGGNNFTTTDNLYLLSGVEVFGVDSNDTAASTTTQLDYYQGMESDGVLWGSPQYPRARKDSHWWLRTPYARESGTFRFATMYGSIYYKYYTNTYGVAPAFRIV